MLEYNEYLESIYINLNKIHPQNKTIDYFFLKLLQFCLHRNLSEVSINHYAKIKTHLQLEDIINQFRFHYTIQYNKYTHYQLSNEQICN